MKELSKKEAYSRASALCSKSEKCESDIRKKLYDWHVDAAEHDEVIDSLIENKYINEERFATYFVRDKYRFNNWGKIKIKYQLGMKRIPAYLITQAMEAIDEEEYLSLLLRAMHAKNRSIKTDDKYQRRQKLMRFAAGRGYSHDEINRALEDLLSEDDREDDLGF